jgi:hypothetical protein
VPVPVTSEASTNSKPGRQPAAGSALPFISGQLLAATAANTDGDATLSPLPAAIDRVEAGPGPQLNDAGWLVATVLTVVVLAAGGLSEVRSRRRAERQV